MTGRDIFATLAMSDLSLYGDASYHLLLEDVLFTAREIMQLRVCVELKIASLKRGVNTNREPAFKALYESELREYTALQSRLLTEVTDVKVPEGNVSRPKP